MGLLYLLLFALILQKNKLIFNCLQGCSFDTEVNPFLFSEADVTVQFKFLFNLPCPRGERAL